jgi:hypothetical protein
MKSEQNKCGPGISAEMDGGPQIKDTLKKYNKETHPEIEFCKLQYPNDDDGEQNSYEQPSTQENKYILVVYKLRILVANLKCRDVIIPGDMPCIVP